MKPRTYEEIAKEEMDKVWTYIDAVCGCQFGIRLEIRDKYDHGQRIESKVFASKICDPHKSHLQEKLFTKLKEEMK